MKTNYKNNLSSILMAIIMLAVILVPKDYSYAQPVEDWTLKYNGFDNNDKPTAMTIDSEGNIYMTGISEDRDYGLDILTVKFSNEGKELWNARYSGALNSDGSDDGANSIAVDKQGNVFVAGYTHGGYRGKDFIVIKYKPNGEQEWSEHYSGEGNVEDSEDEAVALTVDNSGDVIVTGYSNNADNGVSIVTMKYNTKGEMYWRNLYLNGSSSVNKPSAVKTDSKNAVIVTGTGEGLTTGKDFLTVKYNSDGKEQWVRSYNGLGGNLAINDDEAVSLDLDIHNNIFISGYSTGALTSRDFLTVNYSPDGDEVWVSRYDNNSTDEEKFDDEPKSVKADAFGNVFVTGRSFSNTTGNSDFLTVKISGRGKTEWANTHTSPMLRNTEDGAEAMAVDNSGNVIVTGFTGPLYLSNCGNGRRICTIKYTSSGYEKWVKEYNPSNGFEFSNDVSRGVLVDKKGRIFVMGETVSSNSQLDYTLIRYSESDVKTVRDKNILNSDKSYKLNDNFPNPFNPTTNISFSVPAASIVKLAVFDITGKEVAVLVNSDLQKGNYKYEWNAAQFASGTYFYTLQSEGFTQTKRMLLIK